MAVELDFVIPNPAALATQFDVIKVYRSATLGGVYAEISTPTSRVPIRPAIISYSFVDPLGAETNYYRISYFNTRTLLESAQGDPVQGQVDFALEIMSVAELKANYLFGVNLTDDKGIPFPESMFAFYIRAAVSWLEHELDLPLRPLTIVGESHDFRPNEFQQFQWINTHRRPILSVTGVRLTLPANQTVYTYPADWIHVEDPICGIIEILPNSGSLVLPIFSGVGSVLFSQFGGSRRYVPGIHAVDYVAGFARGQIPPTIRHAVGMLASIGPLNIAGDLLGGAGVASYSISLDGLSQSVNTTSSPQFSGYGARILNYNREIKQLLPVIRRYYQGIPLRVA